MREGLHHVWGDELSSAELHELLRLRTAIFVVEQNCPYQEVDGFDVLHTTAHLWYGTADGRVVSYVRVISPDDAARRIGRVCTDAGSRRAGCAAMLVRAAVDAFGGQRLELHAQVTVTGLYESLGFAAVGPEFDEDGIPHVLMVREPVPG